MANPPINQNEIDELLRVVNDKRTAVGSSQKLSWDATLAQHAQVWADTLAKNNQMGHDPKKPQDEGENVFYGPVWGTVKQYTLADASRSFLSEEKIYVGQQDYGSTDPKKMIGHFTQAVWNNSLRIGTGRASRPDLKAVWIVERYGPPGNYTGQYPNETYRQKYGPK